MIMKMTAEEFLIKGQDILNKGGKVNLDELVLLHSMLDNGLILLSEGKVVRTKRGKDNSRISLTNIRDLASKLMNLVVDLTEAPVANIANGLLGKKYKCSLKINLNIAFQCMDKADYVSVEQALAAAANYTAPLVVKDEVSGEVIAKLTTSISKVDHFTKKFKEAMDPSLGLVSGISIMICSDHLNKAYDNCDADVMNPYDVYLDELLKLINKLKFYDRASNLEAKIAKSIAQTMADIVDMGRAEEKVSEGCEQPATLLANSDDNFNGTETRASELETTTEEESTEGATKLSIEATAPELSLSNINFLIYLVEQVKVLARTSHPGVVREATAKAISFQFNVREILYLFENIGIMTTLSKDGLTKGEKNIMRDILTKAAEEFDIIVTAKED